MKYGALRHVCSQFFPQSDRLLERDELNNVEIKVVSTAKNFLTGTDVTDDDFGENFSISCAGGGCVGDLCGFARVRHP